MKALRVFIKRYRQALLTIACVVVVLAVASVVVQRRLAASGSAEVRRVTAAVGQLIILPTNETPTLATVSDASVLKGQAIFTNAQNGDEVLVYSQAAEVLVYRPSAHKLVAVGPLVLDKNGSPYVTSRIAILDGSGSPSRLAAATQAIVADYPNATIVNKAVAPRVFANSIVIDATKANQPLAEQIADALGIKAGQLPLGIAAPAADILIIVGQDFPATGGG